MKTSIAHYLTALTVGIGVLGLTVTSAAADDIAMGKQLFGEACAVCHGADGKGGGEFASELKTAPPNLTTLLKDNGDVYPFVKVYQTIDGRAETRAHGAGDMPIWGTVFSRDATGGTQPFSAELLVRARMVALVEYIESIQQP
ncbi:cytochrome c [Oricola sp.]|uniref:c-type cytochrome n=1 Tax=Oricola sp. TaxID=1979950 RepID=UPI0025FB2707|nr:cytochrome c [Oricola sp.]MCI5076524.1 cytochrome c [Oricola sp.]